MLNSPINVSRLIRVRQGDCGIVHFLWMSLFNLLASLESFWQCSEQVAEPIRIFTAGLKTLNNGTVFFDLRCKSCRPRTDSFDSCLLGQN